MGREHRRGGSGAAFVCQAPRSVRCSAFLPQCFSLFSAVFSPFCYRATGTAARGVARRTGKISENFFTPYAPQRVQVPSADRTYYPQIESATRLEFDAMRALGTFFGKEAERRSCAAPKTAPCLGLGGVVAELFGDHAV